MCTVTFLPTGNAGYILTSNRDEWSGRNAALPPRRYQVNGKYLFFPKDPQAGGTWIATCEQFHTLCLLNGAFEPHVRVLPYRISRGTMVLDFYKYDGLEDFLEKYDFTGIEPFTLIVVNGLRELRLDELRWDGITLRHTSKSVSEPHIWSSATLYSREVIDQRQNWFFDWVKDAPDFTQDSILNFHLLAGCDDVQNGLVMKRSNGVLTQSITSVLKDQQNYRMTYRDLLEDKEYNFRILQSAKNEI